MYALSISFLRVVPDAIFRLRVSQHDQPLVLRFPNSFQPTAAQCEHRVNPSILLYLARQCVNSCLSTCVPRSSRPPFETPSRRRLRILTRQSNNSQGRTPRPRSRSSSFPLLLALSLVTNIWGSGGTCIDVAVSVNHDEL